jgi:hypothetical protein
MLKEPPIFVQCKVDLHSLVQGSPFAKSRGSIAGHEKPGYEKFELPHTGNNTHDRV